MGASDGRPSSFAAEQLWKLWSGRRNFVWAVCLFLVVYMVFTPSFRPSDSSAVDLNTEVNQKIIEISSTTSALPVPQELAQSSRPSISTDVAKLIDFSVGGCDIWRGEWIPHPDGPAYTNATCPYIQETQNCMKNGRPDDGFLYWRWKPHGCELPLFDAKSFLNVVAGKKLAFIGDSIARNHYQSVICHLSQVETPECTFNDGYDGNMQWNFRSYNFTLTVVWSPFLVKGTVDEADGLAQGITKLHLDVVDEIWASALHNYDQIVLSSGHWFLKSGAYFMQEKLVGCHRQCGMLNVTDLGYDYAYRETWRTVYDFLISSKYRGVVFLRTFSPGHWENAPWDQGGNCTKKAPVTSDLIELDGMIAEMYRIQLVEFAKTLQKSSEYSFKLKILDTIYASLLRPDAHPGPYGHLRPTTQKDCVHWCLPGAVDTWSSMLLHLLKHL